MKKYMTLENLQYFSELMKKYIDIKIKLAYNNQRTNCPNCSAPITGTKCEYCGTDFEVIIRVS